MRPPKRAHTPRSRGWACSTSDYAHARWAADGFNPCAVVETSPGNFQAWLKHSIVFPKLIGTFVAQTLAARYDADPSAADWRRFGRLPGFTNCIQKLMFFRHPQFRGNAYQVVILDRPAKGTGYESNAQKRQRLGSPAKHHGCWPYKSCDHFNFAYSAKLGMAIIRA
jgi:RepB DNA-primase from phage plasmid